MRSLSNPFSAGLHTLFPRLFPWRHAGLMSQFVRREVDSRYRQPWLGMV